MIDAAQASSEQVRLHLTVTAGSRALKDVGATSSHT